MNVKNLLDTSKCLSFRPSFNDKECDFWAPAEDESMEPKLGECGFCKKPESYRCVADITRPIPLSHSSVNTFLTCHYLYYLQKILGIQMRPQHFGNPLKAGQLWDTVKQKHLGEKVNVKSVISKYQIRDEVVEKVRALYNAYKELGIEVDEGYSLQAKIDITYDVEVPAKAFAFFLLGADDKTNIWEICKDLEGSEDWTFPLSVTGFYDRKYPTYFCEDKLSGRPEFYLDPFLLQSQNATYFLADPNLEHCIQEVVLFPQQRLKKSGETIKALGERVFDDILSRPSKYFIGYNRKTHRYGKKFFRGEFDLDLARERYQQIVLEVLSCRWTGNFYRNFKSCNNILPGISCDMQTVCKSGNVSESMFEIRGKK